MPFDSSPYVWSRQGSGNRHQRRHFVQLIAELVDYTFGVHY